MDLQLLQVRSFMTPSKNRELIFQQSQLAQMLFSQAMAQSSSGRATPRGSQPMCTTPRGRRTPSNSVSWGMVDAAAPLWSTSTSPRSWSGNEEWPREFDDSEDERMVEDLLIPSSPSFRRPQSPSSSTSRSQSRAHRTSESTFATTDPFYLAQVQALNHQQFPSTTSAFAQMGRPVQQSPFLQNTQYQHSTQAPAIEQRNPYAMFMSTTTFE